MSVRIYTLAKTLGMENKDLLNLLQERGFEVKTASSSIDPISAEALEEEFKKLKEKEETRPDSGSSPDPSPQSSSEDSVTAKSSTEPKSLAGRAPSLPAGPIVKTAAEIEAAKAQLKTQAKPPVTAVPPVRRPGVTPPVPPVRSAGSASAPPPIPKPSVKTPPPVVPPVQKTPPPVKSPPKAGPPPVPPIKKKEEEEKPETDPASRGFTEKDGEVSGDVVAAAQEEAAPELKKLVVKPPIVVQDFAEKIGTRPFKLISMLMDQGIFGSLNHAIDEDIATKIAAKHGFFLEIRHRGENQAKDKIAVQAVEDDPQFREPCPPVACILGHVDHGKTTLLDAIRKTKVVDDEFGGITQHIGAYQVGEGEKRITFLDTPGHAAFSKMRERGVNLTDIAILVVAADDGFKPQTDEALKFAKRSNVQVIVAITKTDVKGANIDRVKTQMQERGIASEDWGGTVITVPVSAVKGEGLEELLEMIILQTEVMELKANPKGKARGVIVEAQMEQGRGCTATVIVQAGTLKVGDALVCGESYCRVRAMHDSYGKTVKEATPSFPVKILGWSDVPDTGSTFKVVKNEREAKSIAADNREERLRQEEEMLSQMKSQNSAEDNLAALFGAIEQTQKKTLRVLLKSDVKGSLEALGQAVAEIKSDQVDLKIVGGGIGPISKKDVSMASASGASIFGFNVPIENGVRGQAKHEGVSVYQDNIIYSILDTVRNAMADLLEPELHEKKIGEAEVRAIFPLGKKKIAGSMVIEGRIVRNARARLMRGGEIVAESTIESLKRFKDDATEVKAGYECGIRLEKVDDYREGDHIEIFEIEKIRPSL